MLILVTGNLSLHSSASENEQYFDDETHNWPSDDDIASIEEMTQKQDLKFHDLLQKSQF
jgi:hypothetical protein